MALIVKANVGPERPTGSFPAICVDAIDAGWYPPGPVATDPTWIRKVKLRFYYEVVVDDAFGDDDAGEGQVVAADLRHTASIGTGESQGFYADLFTTASIGKKSNLGKFLEAWRGTPFTDKEREGFDLDSLLGQRCIINVVPGNAGYVNVTSAGKLVKAMRHLAPDVPVTYVKDRDGPEPTYTKHQPPAAALPIAQRGTGQATPPPLPVQSDVRKATIEREMQDQQREPGEDEDADDLPF